MMIKKIKSKKFIVFLSFLFFLTLLGGGMLYMDYKNKGYIIKVNRDITIIKIDKMYCIAKWGNLLCYWKNIFFRKPLIPDKENPNMFFIDFCPTDVSNVDFAMLNNKYHVLEFGEKGANYYFTLIPKSYNNKVRTTFKIPSYYKEKLQYAIKYGRPSTWDSIKDYFLCRVNIDNYSIILRNVTISFNHSNIKPMGYESILIKKPKLIKKLEKENKVKISLHLYTLRS